MTADAEGPGKIAVPWWGIIIIGLYLMVITGACMVALAQMWPHPTPTSTVAGTGTNVPAADVPEAFLKARCGTSQDCRQCEENAHAVRDHLGLAGGKNDPECLRVLWLDVVMWNERRLLLIVILAGALGGLISSLRSFFWYVGNRNLVTSWVPMYFLAPITSGLLGAMIYLVVRGGFFSGMSTISDTSPYTFAAVAALVGMFHRETAEKLREVFQIVFTRAQSGKDSSDHPKPKLTRITPDGPLTRAADTRLTLLGEGFTEDSVVRLDGVPLGSKILRVSDKEITVTVRPADLEQHDTEVVVTVFNPTPGGGTSDGIKLAVQPRSEPAKPPDE